MPPFVKMVDPYNFLRVLVVDPFSDTVQAKLLTPHTALISGIHAAISVALHQRKSKLQTISRTAWGTESCS